MTTDLWERKLSLVYLWFVILLCILMAALGDDAHGQTAYKAVLCPPDWKIVVAQRYDKRDKWDWIVKRTWIARCI